MNALLAALLALVVLLVGISAITEELAAPAAREAAARLAAERARRERAAKAAARAAAQRNAAALRQLKSLSPPPVAGETRGEVGQEEEWVK